MSRLKAAIIREYEDDQQNRIEVYNPRNTQAVELHFRGEKTAKIVGKLAQQPPQDGQIISGVLVKRNFNYHLMDPSDLSAYTELSQSVLTQRQSVFYSGSLPLLDYYLRQIASGDVEQVQETQQQTKPSSSTMDESADSAKKKMFKVFRQISVQFEPPVVILEWVANPVNDMYADAVLAAVLQAEANPIPLKSKFLIFDEC